MANNILQHFLDEWLDNEEWWFSPTHQYDEIIKDKFGCILDNDYGPCENLSDKELCALCIAYDQIPRHVYREDKQQIDKFLQKSLFIFRHIQDVSVYDGWLLCFLLLPLRHTRILSTVKEAVEIIWRKLEDSDENKTVYKRFLKATYQKISSHQDMIYFDGASYYNLEQFRDILDFKGTFDDIKYQDDNILTLEFNKYIDNDKPHIISISGGVDSMIASYLAKRYLKHVVCLHINYANRPTSYLESKFVEHWCSLIGLPLYIRHITEINRPLCMKYDLRETYETYTKEVRYACYKEVSKLHWGSDNVNVILGHNKDDCFENILTNIRNCNKYENLLGMDYNSIIDSITFNRPFLDIPKAKIIEFAQQLGISYLYDSTPKWSQRGKIRDHIVPTLNDWDTQCINSMFVLANRMTELIALRDKYVKCILKTMTKREDASVCVYELSCDIQDLDANTLRAIFKELQVPQPSQKSLISLIDRLKSKQTMISYNLSKGLKIKIYALPLETQNLFKHNISIFHYKNE